MRVASANVDAFIKAGDCVQDFSKEGEGEPEDPMLGVSAIGNTMNHESFSL